jgi:hypothetical protein
MDAAARVRAMVNGYQVSHALSAAASLGLSDLLAQGPRTPAELASSTGCDEPTLLRLLRALTEVGVYAPADEGRFASTELGEQLRSDLPGSVAGWAAFVGRGYHQQAWAALADSVRTGENAFLRVHGVPVWEYRARHPEEQQIFDRAMASFAGAVGDAVAASYDFGGCRTVVDVGGGSGTLLAAVLDRYPGIRGVVFDQPAVVAGARELLAARGLAARSELVGGDFFAGVPEGGDAYLLKSIVHDWPDDDAVRLLRSCRSAMREDAVLLLVERLLGEGPDPVGTAFSDLNMLVGPGGRERDRDGYARLLEAAGLRLDRAVPTGTDVFVLEARPMR